MGVVVRRSEVCSACKIRPVRGPKQRYCKECHNEACRKHRRSIGDKIAALLMMFHVEQNANKL